MYKVGDKLELLTEVKFHNGKRHEIVNVHPRVMIELKMQLGTNVRVKMPDKMYTSDYVYSRQNVHVDATGLITAIDRG